LKVKVLRLGHRYSRDRRISTHIGLVARAFGADELLMDVKDSQLEESISKITEEWGGDFRVTYLKDWRRLIKGWKKKGSIIHLTMYGLPIQEKIKEIRKLKNLLIIVGGKKVPSEVYGVADYNISITQQPHSEVASLCYFLDYYFKRKELTKRFNNARLRIIPQERGKEVVEKK